MKRYYSFGVIAVMLSVLMVLNGCKNNETPVPSSSLLSTESIVSVISESVDDESTDGSEISMESGTESSSLPGSVASVSSSYSGSSSVSQSDPDPTWTAPEPKDIAEYKADVASFDLNDPLYTVEYTEAEKEQQRNNGTELLSLTRRADMLNENEIFVEPGVYRFADGVIPFNFSGKDGMTIYLDGVEIILEGHQNVFRFENSNDITIRGDLIVDRDPLPFVQFRVISYNTLSQNLEVQILPGYDYETTVAGSNLQFFNDDGSWIPHCFITPKGEFIMTDKANRIGVFTQVPCNPRYGDDVVLKAGTLGASVVQGWNAAVATFIKCEKITMTDVTNYAGGLFLYETQSKGPNRYERDYNIRRPGTNRLIAGPAGQIQYIEDGPTFKNCIFGFTDDDGLDILSFSHMIYAQEAPNVIIFKPTQASMPLKNGDTLNFFDGPTYEKIGSAKVVSFEEIKDEAMMTDARNKALQQYNYFDSMSTAYCVRVVLDSNVEVKIGDSMENDTSFRPSNVLIKDCYFHDLFCRVLVQGCDGLVIEGNLIERTGLAAIDIDCEQAYWAEGPNSKNVIIRNNTIIDSPCSPYMNNGPTFTHSGAISVGVSQRTYNTPSRDWQSFSNILIEGNKIYNSMYSGILVKNAINVTIKNNLIENPCTKIGTPEKNDNPGQSYYGEEPLAGIYLYSCKNVTLSGNTITKKGKYVLWDIRKLYCVD